VYHIRYYEKRIHPDALKGALGFFVFVLNWIRWKLEVLVQSLMLRYLVKVGGIPRDKEIQLRRMFSMDVQAEKLDMARTSPNNSIIQEDFPTIERTDHSEGRFGNALTSVDDESEKETTVNRPGSIQDMISRYSAPKRVRGYASRHEYFVHDVTDDNGEEGGFRGIVSVGRGGKYGG